MSLPLIVFWCSVAGLAYIYAGYPLLVWLLGRSRRRDLRRAPWTGGLSIVVVTYNEARRLRARLDNLFASESADQIVEVLVGSDGSDDDTPAVVAAYPDPRVRLIHFAERRGKPDALNDLVPQCRSELVVLCDVRQTLASDALSRLAENFADERVGVVSGELMFRASDDDTAAAVGMGAYWTYEKLIRKNESRFRGVPGATGALYALRRSLFRPVRENTLLDDVVIPMQAIEQGALCLLESGAIAWDVPSQSPRQESVRKRRTIAGCAQLVVNQPRWLLPWRNPIWWEFTSHKLARLASPLLLATLLVSSIVLSRGVVGWAVPTNGGHSPPDVPSSAPLYAVALAMQGALYAAALVAWPLQRRSLRAPLLGPVLMFVSLNLTTLAALWDACRGRYRAAWQRTA